MLETPEAIAAEHRLLHNTLYRASHEEGALGMAARELVDVFAPHYDREEKIATPPLALLRSLASGEATAEMRSVLPLTDALERELPHMLKEHEVIRAAIKKFHDAALAAHRHDYVEFCDELAAHAEHEEEILYPAAILVGRYVAMKAPQ